MHIDFTALGQLVLILPGSVTGIQLFLQVESFQSLSVIFMEYICTF